jgi:beta-lactamase class A
MLDRNRLSRTVGSVTQPDNFLLSRQFFGFLAGVGVTSSIIFSLAGFIALSFWLQSFQSETFQSESFQSDSQIRVNHGEIAPTHKRIEFKTTFNFSQENAELLEQIARETGLSAQAKITVCNLKRDCRALRGDEPPTSVASLMKVPIAEALLHKISLDKISLDTPIYISEGNFTEDGSDLEVEQNYPLGKLLSEMIVNSSNIAPNQLIDYLGRGYINQVLQNRGYRETRVTAKFIGDISIPVDAGEELNRSTSNELTEMMVQIYNRENPGDDLLIGWLGQQHDQELGFAALQNSPATWLGEKTGQNSWVLGTTLAMEITGNIYIVTVIDDGFYSDMAIRDTITKIAEYIAREGHL